MYGRRVSVEESLPRKVIMDGWSFNQRQPASKHSVMIFTHFLTSASSIKQDFLVNNVVRNYCQSTSNLFAEHKIYY